MLCILKDSFGMILMTNKTHYYTEYMLLNLYMFDNSKNIELNKKFHLNNNLVNMRYTNLKSYKQSSHSGSLSKY
jgi:hypothetical protein